jgi:hypothetical protein
MIGLRQLGYGDLNSQPFQFSNPKVSLNIP